jgi:hypothetical protein
MLKVSVLPDCAWKLARPPIGFFHPYLVNCSSASIVSDYGLDDRAIGVRSSAGAKDFSRPALGPTQPPVQWVLGVLSPGLNRDRGVTLTTHHMVPRS